MSLLVEVLRVTSDKVDQNLRRDNRDEGPGCMRRSGESLANSPCSSPSSKVYWCVVEQRLCPVQVLYAPVSKCLCNSSEGSVYKCLAML